MKKTFIGRVCSIALSLSLTAASLGMAAPMTVSASDDFEDEMIFEEDFFETDEEVEVFEDDLENADEMITEQTEEDFIGDELEEETEIEIELPDQSGLRENSFRYHNGQRIDEGLFYSESGDFEREWTWDGVGWLNSIGEYIPGAKQKGIDVSYAQGYIDWDKVQKTDVSWAIIRCGYGDDLSDQDDVQWERNTAACEARGIPYGVYIYSYATTVEEAKSEAEHVLRLVRGKKLSMPIYYDLEDEATTGRCSNEEIAKFAKTFCDIIENNGYSVGIYASKSWFTSKLTDPCFNRWTKWVAQYYSECTYSGNYDIWQCTGLGYVDGINYAVDLNFSYYNVSGGTPPVITPTEPEPVDPEPVKPDPEDKIVSFVHRLYAVVLGREPDTNGLNSWVNKLKNKQITGAQTAAEFFNSTEYLKKKTSDTQYLIDLYNTFFGRKPDETGKNYWMNQIQKGKGRNFILKGFAESNEFTKICTEYGIVRGTITLTDTTDEVVRIQKFISRNYSQFLGRNAESSGLQYWTNKMVSKEMTPAEVARGFVFSNEFKNKNYTNEQFILKMYLGLFGRDADAKGFTDWRTKMKNGMTREQVFDGFIVSNEFKAMVAQFGL